MNRLTNEILIIKLNGNNELSTYTKRWIIDTNRFVGIVLEFFNMHSKLKHFIRLLLSVFIHSFNTFIQAEYKKNVRLISFRMKFAMIQNNIFVFLSLSLAEISV